MSLSVLVAGGAGYVGSHAVKHLVSRGHEVVVYDNLSRGHADAVPGAQLVEGDLLDPARLRDAFRGRAIDVVMHFAALCYVGESVREPREYYRNNVSGTINLLDAMLEASVRRLVFSSTCSTYGNPVEVPMRETHPQHPVNPYGASKLMVETILRDYAGAYRLASVSLRYFNAAGCDPEGRIGERHDPETHLIPLVLLEALRIRLGGDPADTRLVVNGNDHEAPDGTCVRDYVHVDDLADAHLRAAMFLMDAAHPGALAFNLGTGRGHSVLQVIESCRAVTGLPIQYRIGPRRAGDPPRLVAESGSAREALGWRPAYEDIDRIVETAWRWFSGATQAATGSRCTSSG
jgi:UDP-glucose 4-epimerase